MYYDNIGKQNAESVESDNVGETVVKLCDGLAEQKRTEWIGPVRELLNELKMIAGAINIDTNSKDWPKLSNGLSRRLKRNPDKSIGQVWHTSYYRETKV